ncbi:hypothetical protein PVAP13_J683556 [Panicum virgatum]|nr:hypothetical protein PVAP13_J683556 [Panicum virgatum]
MTERPRIRQHPSSCGDRLKTTAPRTGRARGSSLQRKRGGAEAYSPEMKYISGAEEVADLERSSSAAVQWGGFGGGVRPGMVCRGGGKSGAAARVVAQGRRGRIEVAARLRGWLAEGRRRRTAGGGGGAVGADATTRAKPRPGPRRRRRRRTWGAAARASQAKGRLGEDARSVWARGLRIESPLLVEVESPIVLESAQWSVPHCLTASVNSYNILASSRSGSFAS